MEGITGMTWKTKSPVFGSTRRWLYAFLAASISFLLALVVRSRQPKRRRPPPQSGWMRLTMGKWKYHLKRLNPLTGSNKWIDLSTTNLGRREIDQINDDASTHRRPDAHTYNPEDTNGASIGPTDGHVDVPQVRFETDTASSCAGHDQWKTIFVRVDWSAMNTNSPTSSSRFLTTARPEVNWSPTR
jgi:hypothetical protein